jgi:hypothetical protein
MSIAKKLHVDINSPALKGLISKAPQVVEKPHNKTKRVGRKRKLSDATRLQVYWLFWRQDYTAHKLAVIYGVHRTTIDDIIRDRKKYEEILNKGKE